jgi:serine/threonine protein kinase
VTLYQKLDVTMDDVLRELTSSNVIGTGSSGVVYKVETPNGYTLAVKKMWPSSDEAAFRSEIAALGSIRHRNIVRLLGWALNGGTRLLFYSYLPNGSLSGFLHGGGGDGKGAPGADEWGARYDVALGVAHAVAYLHHDCVPAILHGDIKAMNVLLGPAHEPYLADFGLARVLSTASSKLDTTRQTRIAGSYGYIAPGPKAFPRASSTTIG